LKANRAFRNDDEAVSPVIAVILMVAITVVLAATVYVWVQGYSGDKSRPNGAVALRNEDATTNPAPNDYYKTFTITSSLPGIKYEQVAIEISTEAIEADLGALCDPVAPGYWTACAGAARGADEVISAGDTITLRLANDPDGATVRIVDPTANVVLYTIIVQ
jgi:flagellin-like protein